MPRTTASSRTSAEDSANLMVAQVARLGRLDPEVVERVRHEVLSTSVPWKVEYGQHQSGGWWTASLMNSSGEDADARIADCDPVPTALLQRLPATRRFLELSGITLMWVRLARLGPNSFLWEHRDYTELARTPRCRLHVPLVTNPSAFLVTGGRRVEMAVGHIWRLQPTYAHGACNLLGPDRLHLVIDAYGESGGLLDTPRLDPADVHHLPAPSVDELDRCVARARSLVALGFLASAERYLLRLYYSLAMDEGHIYDMIIDLHRRLGRTADVARWTDLRRTLLERDDVAPIEATG